MTALAVQQLIADARVPGLSMAVIHDRQATALTAVGVRNSLDRAAVDQQTIFAAASLSKPLFAYAVLQLVDAGKLAFDTPLSLHVPDYVTDDPRAAAVTVRHVLSHTSPRHRRLLRRRVGGAQRNYARSGSKTHRRLQHDGLAYAPPRRHQRPTSLRGRALGDQGRGLGRFREGKASEASANTKCHAAGP